MDRTWFRQNRFSKVTISDYAKMTDCSFGRTGRKDKVARRIEITDKNIIDMLVRSISALPPEGDMMVSFGDDIEYLLLEFISSDGVESVEFYGNHIKTPGTSFYTEEKDEIAEKKVYDYINTLLR